MDKRGLPSARRRLLDIMEKIRKGELKIIIKRYLRQRGSISFVAPEQPENVVRKAEHRQ